MSEVISSKFKGVEWAMQQISIRDKRIEQLQEQINANQWQPIETAPEGKTMLLWWIPKDPNPYAEAIVIGQLSGYEEHEGEWWDVQSGKYQSLKHITHWMPLPEPPQALQDKETPTAT